jgi:hypothetical protein
MRVPSNIQPATAVIITKGPFEFSVFMVCLTLSVDLTGGMVAMRKIEVQEPAGCLRSSWSGDAFMNSISQEILKGPIVVIMAAIFSQGPSNFRI